MLIDAGLLGFSYISASPGSTSDSTWTSHAWLQNGNLVIDLTADQFEDAPDAIIVSDSSEWHQTFRVDGRSPPDFRVWSGWGAEMLQSMYARIQAQMAGRKLLSEANSSNGVTSSSQREETGRG